MNIMDALFPIKIEICTTCKKEFKYVNIVPKIESKIVCYSCLILSDNPNGVKLVK